MIDDSYLLADTISHIGQRRRERKRGIMFPVFLVKIIVVLT